MQRGGYEQCLKWLQAVTVGTVLFERAVLLCGTYKNAKSKANAKALPKNRIAQESSCAEMPKVQTEAEGGGVGRGECAEDRGGVQTIFIGSWRGGWRGGWQCGRCGGWRLSVIVLVF